MNEFTQNLKNSIADEKKKLHEMTFNEKRIYIWEYYKLPIIATVLIIATIGSIINNVFINPPKKPFVHIAFFGTYISDEDTSRLSAMITEDMVTDKETEMCYTTGFYTNPDDTQVNMATMQKLMAMVAAKELDIMISNRSDFEGMGAQGMLMDLSLIMPAEDMRAFSDRLMEGHIEDEDRDCMMGIDLTGIPIFEGFVTPMEGSVLSVVSSTGRPDKALAVLRYILAKGN